MAWTEGNIWSAEAKLPAEYVGKETKKLFSHRLFSFSASSSLQKETFFLWRSSPNSSLNNYT
jgi:hypothetical protein